MQAPRVGIGYDLHRLVPGRALILGGIAVPSDRGLEGHSDADVVCHALIDAMLGASALGDIGQHFPPDDPKWLDANSLELLRQAWDQVSTAGYEFGNADVTIVAEAPKLSPWIATMRSSLASALDTDPARISVKATTREGLGPEGRGEAISAYAVCLLLPLHA